MDSQQNHSNNESASYTPISDSDQTMEDVSVNQQHAYGSIGSQVIETQSSRPDNLYFRHAPFPRDALNEDFATLKSIDDADSNFPTQDGAVALASDPIRSFTDDDWNDHESTENILDGLDDWRPVAGGDGSTLSIHDDLDDLLQVEGKIPAGAVSQAWTEDEIEEGEERMESAPELQFEDSDTVLPTIALQLFKDEPPKRMTLKFKEDRIGFKALQQINRATREYAIWEKHVRAEMAKQGSIARVCMAFEHGQLFRIVRTWVDRGHIFGRCIRVRPYELNYLLGSSSTTGERVEVPQTGDGVRGGGEEEEIEELFSQPTRLPPYRPMEDEDQFVFLFSFAYMRPPEMVKERLLEEECVAVWPPLTTVAAASAGQDIYVVTRFMCHAIY